MQLTSEQLQAYHRDGFLFLPHCFSSEEINRLKEELPALLAEDSPRRVVEKNSQIVRSIYGTHMTNMVCQNLTRHPRLLQPAEQILQSKVYIHQFKINAKAAFGGDLWEWHQDYVFWRKEDGIVYPWLVNAVVFLDDVNEFNGPMLLIPGSHKEGVIDVAARDMREVNSVDQNPYKESPEWISNLTADLKYSLTKETIRSMVEGHGIVAPKGPAGSVLFFHGNIAHCSAANMSPFDRSIAILTYNHIDNTPKKQGASRPEFLAARDYTPLVPGGDDILLPTVETKKE